MTLPASTNPRLGGGGGGATRSPSPANMPWLSQIPTFPPSGGGISPLPSPSMGGPPRVASSNGKQQPCPPVTYIPPLIDGACGTTPLSQKPLGGLLRDDLKALWAVAPRILGFMRSTMIKRPGEKWTWAQTRDAAVQLCLAAVEVAMLVSAVPLWLGLPGVVFATWLAMSMSLVYGLSWVLNGDAVIVTCDGSESWSMENETEEERWFFIGGLCTSVTHLSNHTLPLLARLFTQPIIGIHAPTYGLPFDLLLTLAHRALPALQTASPASRALYTELRAALLDCSLTRVTVLSHNTGSIPLASVLARLSADIQPEKFAKLEIFTFGAAARELAVPLGETKRVSPVVGGPRYDEAVVEARGPHIEHFALAGDPFAQMGVLKAVHCDFDGRFCGGVFVMNGNSATSTNPGTPSPESAVPSRRRQPRGHLTDYLAALFPSSMPTPDIAPGTSSILDYTMHIDRDVAEKRELAAMASYAEAKKKSSSVRKENRRTSWTGLGATVGSGDLKNGVMDGVVGLEMARRGCRDCDGHRAREVSRLADYVRTGGWPGGIVSHQGVADVLGVGRTMHG